LRSVYTRGQIVGLGVFILGATVALLTSFAGAKESGSGREEAVRKLVYDYVGASADSDLRQVRYLSSLADLKDDGRLEAIVYLMDNEWCGSGGCTMLILAPKDSSYEVVTKITVTRPPIRILKTKTNGWHDLSVFVAGGGIVPGYDAKLSFDGSTYPSNPSTAPANRIIGEVSGQDAISVAAYKSEVAQEAVRSVLSLQQEAWNHHDLDAFMAGYWKSAELTFFSGAKQTSGWQATLDRYKATYDSPGHEMGKLEFSNLRVEALGPDAAFARGEFHLTMPDGKTPHGIFTLVFRKFPDGWKIVHDHTSAAE